MRWNKDGVKLWLHSCAPSTGLTVGARWTLKTVLHSIQSSFAPAVPFPVLPDPGKPCSHGIYLWEDAFTSSS